MMLPVGTQRLQSGDEFQGLVKALESTDKELTIEKQVLTVENFQAIISGQPKIIQIQCEGDFDN